MKGYRKKARRGRRLNISGKPVARTGRGSFAKQVVRGLAKYGPAAIRAGVAIGMKRKAWTPRRVVTKRRKLDVPKDLGYQMQVNKYQWGRNRSQLSMLRTLDAASSWKSVILRFGAINRCTAAQGAFSNALISDATTQYYPLKILELTQRPPATNDYIKNEAFRGFTQNISTAVPTWNYINGVANATGAATQYWEGMSGPSPTSIIQDVDMAYLQWAKVKFCFRTPTQRAGRVTVQLVSFTDDDFIPGNSLQANHEAFWGHQMTGLLYNPIKTDGVMPAIKKRSTMKILKQWNKSWQPQQTTEGDTSPNHIRLELFLRLNKFVDFRTTGPSGDGAAQTVAENLGAEEMIDGYPGGNAVQLTERWNVPRKVQHRLYLIIKSSNYDDTVAAVDTTKHLTFDMEAQTKWVVNVG